MTPASIGIDTTILVRLVTHEPEDLYRQCVATLRHLIEIQGVTAYASNQVIGETYVTVQHHYGATKEDSRVGILRVLTSGLVEPLNGQAVLDALAAASGPGLFDRLIINGYAAAGLETRTLDRQMTSLPGVRRLL